MNLKDLSRLENLKLKLKFQIFFLSSVCQDEMKNWEELLFQGRVPGRSQVLYQVRQSGGKSWTSRTPPAPEPSQVSATTPASRTHCLASRGWRCTYWKQHQNFQINPTSCFRYLGNDNGQKNIVNSTMSRSTWDTKMYTGQEDSHLLRFFFWLIFLFRHLAIEPSRAETIANVFVKLKSQIA